MEVVKFIKETYWSKDYIVEIDGSVKVAKFVYDGLIHSPSDVVLKSESARNVYGILVPERFLFENGAILIYDLEKYEPLYGKRNEIDEINELAAQVMLNAMRNILHVPKLFLPFIGLDDIIVSDGDIKVFLPFVQDLDYVIRQAEKEGTCPIYIAPEVWNGEISDKSTLYVFGKIISDLTENDVMKQIAFQMSSEEPDKRTFSEEVPYYRISGRKKTLRVKRISRAEEEEILGLIRSSESIYNYVGIIGPQRVGKTTVVENLESYLRESGIPFIHAVTGSDIISQTLQLVSDSISKELLDELMYCVENVCKIDTVSISIVEALSNIKRIVIFVDDYQETPEGLRVLLKKISELDKSGRIIILCFSIEEFEEFQQKIYIEPFTVDLTKEIIVNSIGNVGNLDILAKWLTSVSNGLPGLIVEYLKYLYENEILSYRDEKYYFDLDAVEDIEISDVIFENVYRYLSKKERYLAILGQKFYESEIKSLESLLNVKFELSGLISEGIIYKEYNRFRFALKQYWEILYSSITEDERTNLHKQLSNIIADPEKKAWHLEIIGETMSAVTVYLKNIYERFNYYSSPSLVRSLIEHVKDMIGDRVSYSVIKFEVELAERTEELNGIQDLEIPDTELYSYYKALRSYITFDNEESIEILERYPTGYGRFGALKRKLLYLRARFEKERRRADFYGETVEIISQLDEKNFLHAKILVEAYIFLSNLMSTNPQGSMKYLKIAEKIALDYNIAHRLPTIYNNMSVNASSAVISMEYLRKSMETAERIGLPARGFYARLNMLYHALYSGNIKEFVDGIMEIRPKLKILGLRNELIYSNILEAYYHAYNFELDEALEHIDECVNVYKEKGLDIEKVFVHFINRDLEGVMRLLEEGSLDITDERVKDIVEVLKSIGTDVLPVKWENYVNSQNKLFREELLAVLGEELTKSVPNLVRRELEHLEVNFILDGALLSLALLYEGYGHYYKTVGNEYKARVYYAKSATIYRDIGLTNAFKEISERYGISSEKVVSHMQTEDSGNSELPFEILSSLRILDTEVQPETLLNYFISKIISILPVNNAYMRIQDDVLDKVLEAGIGEFKSFSNEFAKLSPFEVYLRDNIDEHALYEIYVSNRNLVLQEKFYEDVISSVQVLEYGIVSVLKGLLTRLRSFVDPLTKLYTRYYFSKLLSLHFENTVNFGSPLSVVMCDIDNFKKINDTYGHLVGDEVLKKIAKIFRENVRNTDILGRFGGEEFVMLFPGLEIDETVGILERLRRMVRDLEEFPFRITLSYGVSNYPASGVEFHDQLIQNADIALYHAKSTGKDKIVVYTEGMTGGLHA
ncbi:MAG TPA: diguanylate cyclase [Fervidobacterium sp.]|nr:diguanylate cyclase [Fervidobacterium sp.]HQE48459.1 diguanylate cyclase [Fervidobacterium sp.]HUM42254.1 diguanylate cyclase [Fervidobacterium sp.]